jgi:phosphoglycolate phosphatase-like HAD superfamily hydrolase
MPELPVGANAIQPLVLRFTRHTRAAVSFMRNCVEHVRNQRAVPRLRSLLEVDDVPLVLDGLAARGVVSANLTGAPDVEVVGQFERGHDRFTQRAGEDRGTERMAERPAAKLPAARRAVDGLTNRRNE